MQFMITFNHVEGVWDALPEEAREVHSRDLAGFVEDLAREKNSKLVFLSFPEQRKTVRMHEPGGELEVLDGPAIPGPEQVGGYFLIDADSLDEAVEWARRSRWLVGSNEVRQVFSAPD